MPSTHWYQDVDVIKLFGRPSFQPRIIQESQIYMLMKLRLQPIRLSHKFTNGFGPCQSQKFSPASYQVEDESRSCKSLSHHHALIIWWCGYKVRKNVTVGRIDEPATQHAVGLDLQRCTVLDLSDWSCNYFIAFSGTEIKYTNFSFTWIPKSVTVTLVVVFYGAVIKPPCVCQVPNAKSRLLW